MATINYPLWRVVDDAGTLVSGATVTIASVTDADNAAIASHGATVHQAGPNVVVSYDAEAKGDAWITLTVTKAGSTFTGENASPAAFLTVDPSKIGTNLDATVSSRLATGTDVSGAAVVGSAGAALRAANTTLDATISSRAAAGDAMTLANGAITSAKFATITPGLTGFLERLALLAWRFFPAGAGKVTQPATVASSGSECRTYAADGTTIIATQPVSNDGTTETLGAAS